MKQRGRKSAASLSVVTGPQLMVSRPADDLPPAPDHLANPERRIWDEVVRDWKGTAASFVVLATALEAHQRAREAREIIADEGMVVTGRDGQTKAHPLCSVERDARAAFQRTFKQLGIKTLMERRRPDQGRELGPYKRHELLTGEIIYPQEKYSGYGDGTGTDLTAFVSDEMRADWEANRDQLMAFWRSGEYTTGEISLTQSLGCSCAAPILSPTQPRRRGPWINKFRRLFCAMTSGVSDDVEIKFSRELLTRLRPEAARRGTTARQLVRDIVEVVVADQLITAVLDDDQARAAER